MNYLYDKMSHNSMQSTCMLLGFSLFAMFILNVNQKYHAV